MRHRVLDAALSEDAFLRLVAENSRRLSRSRRGIADTSSSQAKSLLENGDELARLSSSNEAAAAAYVWRRAVSGDAVSASDLMNELMSIAGLVNRDITPPGKVFREWQPPVGQRCAASDVPGFLIRLAERVASQLPSANEDPVGLAAEVEWRLNGGDIHPFFDGCGRISRLFSSRILLCRGWAIPLWEDSPTYFAVGSSGLEAFSTYMRTRIRSGMEWLSQTPRLRADSSC